MKRWLVLVTLLLLSGCAAMTWQQDGKSQQDFYADNSYCRAMSQSVYRAPQPNQTIYIKHHGPYRSTGYIQNNVSFIDEMAALTPVLQIHNECMMGKGWQKGQNRGRSISVQPLPIRTEPIRTVSPTPVDGSEQKPSSLGSVFLQYNNLQLRSQPGFSGDTIETIGTSTPLQALNETDYWVYVRTPSGKEGWVAKNWIK